MQRVCRDGAATQPRLGCGFNAHGAPATGRQALPDRLGQAQGRRRHPSRRNWASTDTHAGCGASASPPKGPEALWEVAQGRGRNPPQGLATKIVEAMLRTRPPGQTQWSMRTLAQAGRRTCEHRRAHLAGAPAAAATGRWALISTAAKRGSCVAWTKEPDSSAGSHATGTAAQARRCGTTTLSPR